MNLRDRHIKRKTNISGTINICNWKLNFHGQINEQIEVVFLWFILEREKFFRSTNELQISENFLGSDCESPSLQFCYEEDVIIRAF